ncbi:hypothetical protein LSCM1_06634 [Leishmania martiniquensis]|uniref:Uncharacterized protein n=1 Tax=Leishmania martiniquensis TaxID=1580590 RepID=A0A836L0S1_9TRYP|nr:hypothetical protein LSCM1_06634 [Leishmania martiniquensis]
METDGAAPRDQGAAPDQQFRPIIFCLNSHTPENMDAARVAQLLQPRFRKGDFYILNVSTAANPSGTFLEANNASVIDVKLPSGVSSLPDRLSVGVQSALGMIDAARREAELVAARAKEAQLSALQAEYMEDGLSAEEALAAAHADMQERSDSEGADDDASVDGEDDHRMNAGGRLPPAVCIVNAPLSPTVVTKLACDVAGMAAVVILESPCAVRELTSTTGGGVPKGTTGNLGSNPPSERGRGRGPGAGAAASSSTMSKRQSVCGSGGGVNDVLAALEGARLAQAGDSAFQNVLLQHVMYPTESVSTASPGPQAATLLRPAVPVAQFLSLLDLLLLRVFASWVRYDTWRAGRSLVQVPAYRPLIDSEAALSAVTLEDSAAAAAAEQRPSKRKSGGNEGNILLPTSDDPPTTTPHPSTMAEVAAEQFEYRAYMQRWWVGPSQGSANSTLATREAIQECLQGCLSQVASPQGASTLRTSAETSAAQLAEDVANVCAKCHATATVASGAALPSVKDKVTAGNVDEEPAACGAALISGSASAALAAASVEEALAQTVTAEVGSASLPSVSTAVVMTAGEADALHWMRDSFLARDQHGWHTAVHHWEGTTLCCMHQPTEVVGAPRTRHAAHLLDCPTSFPRFFHEEGFLEAEAHHYAPSSLGEETEEEEEEDASSVQTASDSSRAENGVPAEDEAAAARTSTASRMAPDACPTIDHVDLVSQHLRRRRVLEQVRLSHARPPVQELLCGAAACRAVVTETQWMRAADSTVVEVSRTAANTAQVRCAIMDAGIHLQAGFMLECPAEVVGGSAKAPAPDASASTPLPEPLVPSGVRGFLSVGHQLRVITEVVADNAEAVAHASHTAAVAAAKEAAIVQYEAQFKRAGKASKPRDKSAAATQLTLEQITETLLAALPPPPPPPDPENGDRKAAPARIVMRVHAYFPLYLCVMTATASKAGVPGIHLRCLTPSLHSAHLRPRILLTVHLWKQGKVSVATVAYLEAIRVFVDGVVEVCSPDLASGVRLYLYKGGSYASVSDQSRLLVLLDGRCILYEGAEGGRVVHELQRGRATAVIAPSVHCVEREDGVQVEIVEPGGTDSIDRAGLIYSHLGLARRIRFGDGVMVERGDNVGMWSWRFAGAPMVYCDAVANEIALAADEDKCDRFTYQPNTDAFSLFVGDGEAEGVRVAASVSRSSCRISVFTQGRDFSRGCDEQGSPGGVFAVDCAYGGVYGCVGVDHVYRVSPFGRCFEEVQYGEEPRHRQLVLPEQYKRPKKKIAEALLLPEYPSLSFRRVVSGEDGELATAPAEGHDDSLHLQVSPLLSPAEPARVSASTTRASPYRALSIQPPVTRTQLQVRCIALQEDGTVLTVLDAASWKQWVMWWKQHRSWIPEYSVKASNGVQGDHSLERCAFRLIKASLVHEKLVPLTEAGAENPPGEAAAVQKHVLVLLPSSEGASVPSWCSAGSLMPRSSGCGASVADAEKKSPAAAVAVSQVAELLDAEPATPILMHSEEKPPIAPRTNGRRVTALPAAPGGRGGSLNYWSSVLCPQAAQLSRSSSAKDKESSMDTARADTASPSTDAAAIGTAAAASLRVLSAVRKNTLFTQSTKVPLMHSYRPAADEHTGTNASTRFHTPLLEVQPRQLDFGKVLPGRRYVATVRLTNISTVPCRYRVRVGALVRPFLFVSYSRQFVAPGITTDVQVELTGFQPHGMKDSQISVVHEGGLAEVGVWWCTTDTAQSTQLGDGVTCLGWAVHKPVLQLPHILADDTEQPNEERSLSSSETGVDMRPA